MTQPNEAILPAVRAQLEQAEEKVRIAMRLLREHGWPENASDLRRLHQYHQTWTNNPGGWLWYLEQPSKEGPRDGPT